MYKTPFNDYGFSNDNILVYDKTMNEEEVNKAIEDALDGIATTENISEINEKNVEQDEAIDEINTKIDELPKAEDVTSEIAAAVAQVVANAPEDLDTLKEVADYIASDKTKASEIETKLSEHDDAIETLTSTVENKADASALEDYATKQELAAVDAKVDAIEVPSIEGLAKASDVTSEIATAVEPLATKVELAAVDAKVDAIEMPDVSGFAVKSEVTEEINAVSGALADFESQVETALEAKADASALETLATKAEVEAVDAKVDAIEIPSIEGLAKASDVTSEIAAAVEPLAAKTDIPDVSDLATKTEVEAVDAKVDAIEIPPTNRAFHEDWPTNTTIDAFCAAVSDDPEAVVGESYLGELTCSGLPHGMGNGEVKVEVLGDAENKILLLTATSTNLAPYHWELTYILGDKYGWRAWVEDSSLAAVAKSGDYGDLVNTPTIPSIEGLAVASDVTAEIAAAVADKANASDIPTKVSQLQNDSGFISSHQSLEDYATKSFVGEKIAEVVGEAPETLDTLKEIADALNDDETTIGAISAAIETKANAADVYTKGNIDDKIGELGEVVEVEGQEATYWQEGDELPDGVEVGDIKTEAIEEVTREKSVKEYVDESVQTVNEKPEVMALEVRMNAMENALKRVDANAYQTMMNDLEVLDTLKDTNSVTIEDGTVADIVIPQTTKSKTINAELDPNSTLTLNSRYSVTINNSGSEPTDLDVTAPAVDGYNAATITLNGGEYDTITVTNASLTVQNDATVQNVVITEETTKNLTINAMFAEGATITSNSDAAITLTSKNPEGEEVSVVLDAPGATVTMSSGSWVNVDANVSPDTLIINKNVHIDDLNVTQGNVLVKVARQSDISSVVENYTLATGCTIDHLHDEITSSNVSNLTATGTHTLVEDIAKNGRFAPGIFASDDIVWNLNGHNITFTNTQGYANFLLRGSLHLEINGNGNVVNNAGDYGFWAAAEGVKIVVNGGNFEAATHVLYAEKGTIEVNGGSFKLTNPDECEKDANGNFKFLLNCKDENYTAGKANIIVRGGKFYGWNPSASYGEPGAPVSFVAEGYGVVESTEMIDGVEHKVFEVKPINE